jgi:CubicO group peptidase (beta-lactamase class C family)
MNYIAKNFGFIFFTLFAIGIFVVVPVVAQDKSADVDKIFGWTKPTEPGCATAVSKDGSLVVNKGYGSADLEREVPITTNTIFDAGSIRKQFVAASILMLVEEGKLALTDDIRKYIPELPDYGRRITIDNLLTHTSGIRDWQTLLSLAGGDPTAMTMILRQREINFTPGDEWSYSNSNYVLLPEIVTRVSGMPFSEFARKRIFEPLGMKSTSHPEDPLFLIKNRAIAYKREKDQWKMDMYLGNDRGGAGGLFTTAADLVIWNDALMNGKLGKFVTEKIQEPVTLNNGRKVDYARGLNIELRGGRGGRLVWHSGGSAGYSAVAGHLPEQKISVAITCNLDGGARSALASRLFDLYLPPEAPPAPGGIPGATIPPSDLIGKAGVFFDEKTGLPIQLMVNNNTIAMVGGGQLALVAPNKFRNLRPTLFFMSEAEFELQFLSEDQIEIKTKDGVVTRYRRAKAYTPTADDLKALSGRYQSDELLAIFDANPGKSGLAVQANAGNTIEFKPVERDTFMIGQMLLRFTRDKAGKVTGLEYSNPLLRNVKFTRAGDLRVGG